MATYHSHHLEVLSEVTLVARGQMRLISSFKKVIGRINSLNVIQRTEKHTENLVNSHSYSYKNRHNSPSRVLCPFFFYYLTFMICVTKAIEKRIKLL